jgi:outer membrane autotransporter protein
LEVESEVGSRFVQAGGGKFGVRTRVQARSSVQAGPSVSVNFNERTSVYANYRLELGFDGTTHNNINLGFRTRF